MTYNDIISAFNEHLAQSAKNNWSDFYVGITDNVEERLHGFHKVPKEGHWFIYCPADSEDIARNVEKYFLKKGMDGDTGGGDDDTIFVYCYEIGPNTKER
jgi:hypothetical protein